MENEPLLAPTPDGVDITNTFLRKALLAAHVARTRPKGIPDPVIPDCLQIVHSIRRLIVKALDSLDPTAFQREIRLEWEFAYTDNGPWWEGDENQTTVNIPRRDIKTLHHHNEFIRDILFAKDDVLQYLEFSRSGKKNIHLLVLFNVGEDSEGSGSEESGSEGSESD